MSDEMGANSVDYFTDYKSNYKEKQEEVMSLSEYLELCKEDKSAYASAAERLLTAMGEPEIIDTSKDQQLSRMHQNKLIEVYPAFSDFYGAEDTISQIAKHLKSAAQGLEEKKQILYLLGPVGGGKSSLAERLKALMEEQPFYALQYKDKEGNVEQSPIYESPLGLFDPKEDAGLLEKFGIDGRYAKPIMSPWAVQKMEEAEGDLSRFSVVKVRPSILKGIGITKTEPGDDNNQDISSLVGKTDIRKLEDFSQDDPNSYSFSGGLCKSSQGLMEFVEMFKAPIKVLHPLLTATQEGHFNGTEDGMGAMPFSGVVLAHSNESEWETFRNNKNNEAFIDRVSIVKVPYCLEVSNEAKIYQKLLAESDLKDAPCAPATMTMMAEFSVLSRLKEHENSELVSKMKVYDGENIKEEDPRAKSIQEYKDAAGQDEGMSGSSTRFAFKVLSKVFNFEASGGEIAADPVHLMYVLEEEIKALQLPEEEEQKRLLFIEEHMKTQYKDFIGKEIQTAYLESYSGYGQNLFDRYIMYADMWIQDQEYRDPDTGEVLNRSALDEELRKIEAPAGISNPKDFRNEVVNFVLRVRANNDGENPKWDSYEKLKAVIEAKMFVSTKDLLPVISFGAKASEEDAKKHNDYVERMEERGYTPKQTRFLGEWYERQMKM